MKRILVAFVFLCAALSLLIGTPALSSRVSGLIKAILQLPPNQLQDVLTQGLKQLPHDNLKQVLGNIGVSAIPAPVPKTGQTEYYYTGDDGDLEKGVPWPTPRFTDNDNGTVTDNLTGLVWTKNANLFGMKNWEDACDECAALSDATSGDLTDGSVAGDWRLPNVRELQSLISYGFILPALPNTEGTGHWMQNDPFAWVLSSYYWSSSSLPHNAPDPYAWLVGFSGGYLSNGDKSDVYPVWCVRGGP